MNPLLPILPVLAEETRTDLRWHSMPPAWALALLVIPAICAASWWAYRRETDVPRPARFLLASLRGLALLFFLLVFLGPYAEVRETRFVRSNLVILVDRSQSMATVDGYEPEDARLLARAAGVTEDQVRTMQRVELAKRVLANTGTANLEDWTRDFGVHVFSFGSQATPVVTTGETPDDEAAAAEMTPAARIRERLAEIRATDPATRIGQAVTTVVDAFRLRDENLAGVVVISDGQDNGTVVTPEQAGRRAGALRVPIFAVGVGDPRSPKNIHVGNLRATEVVLARDDVGFEFTVQARGFEGRRVKIDVQAKDGDRWRPLPANPTETVLAGGDGDQEVKVVHRFTEPGLVTVRIGIPPQPEEKIQSDNYVEHTIRVIDRKIRVLYVEGPPRYEFQYLSNALTRDRDTILAHTLLLEADPDTPQRRTLAPDWPALDASRLLPAREALFEYDVLVLGDVNWTDLATTSDKAREALLNIRDFVDKGGGLVLVSGSQNPSRYKDTELQGLLPVVVDRSAEQSDPAIDTASGFSMRLTPEGIESPLMDVAGDPKASRQLWEDDGAFRQFWSYPALRAKTLARVLAVSAHPAHDDPRHGPRPLIATMSYGRGRVLWIGVDELWRMRYEVADRYYYRFYGESIRFLARYRLLGGNKRFKILTDRDQYGVDAPVRITLDVRDRDYEPSKAPSQKVRVDMPGAQPGSRETVELEVAADPGSLGTYRRTLIPTRPGDYRITAEPDDPRDEAPEKLFRVVESTLESRNLLLDETRLREMAKLSEGGRYLALAELPSLRPPKNETPRITDSHDDEIWDSWWTVAVGTALLAAEWLLRKRWHLV